MGTEWEEEEEEEIGIVFVSKEFVPGWSLT